MLPARPSPLGAAATRTSCGLSVPPHSPVEEGSVQGPRDEEGYPQDGDGALPGPDLGVEFSLTSCPTRDPVSLNPVAAHRRHYLSLPEDGRGSG
jgi:hypothetical protein